MKHGARSIFIAAGLLVLTVFPSFSQDRQPGGRGNPPKPLTASEMIAEMTQYLSLTSAQVQKVTPVIKSEVSQMDALMEQERSGSSHRDENRSKIDAIHKSTEKQLAAILTSAQLKKWQSRKGPEMGDRPD